VGFGSTTRWNWDSRRRNCQNQFDNLMLKVPTILHKIKRTLQGECSLPSRIMIPPREVCSYSFTKGIFRFVVVSQVKERPTGSYSEPAGINPPFDTLFVSISILYIHLRLGFLNGYSLWKFKYLFYAWTKVGIYFYRLLFLLIEVTTILIKIHSLVKFIKYERPAHFESCDNTVLYAFR
jgi:hypothetical protein